MGNVFPCWLGPWKPVYDASNQMAVCIMKEGTSYTDLGGDFFDRLEPQRLTRYHVKRLESLGHKVTLESCAAAGLKSSEQAGRCQEGSSSFLA